MLGCAVAKKLSSLLVLGVIISGAICQLVLPTIASAQSTTVGAVICRSQSSITMAQPSSDSTVSDIPVTLSGSVDQASQIEVYVDDVFNDVIPLSTGQSSFSGSVSLTSGTHTIKVVAINVCPGPNGTASSVVTYAPPTETPLTGTSTPTTVGDAAGGVTIGTGGQKVTSGLSPFLLPEVLTIPFTNALAWLNITPVDSTHAHSLSLWRAIVITGGLYLLILGMASVVLHIVAGLPIVTTLLPAPNRIKWLSRGFRVLGLILVLIGLFFYT
jgi:hypothetical protein